MFLRSLKYSAFLSSKWASSRELPIWEPRIDSSSVLALLNSLFSFLSSSVLWGPDPPATLLPLNGSLSFCYVALRVSLFGARNLLGGHFNDLLSPPAPWFRSHDEQR